MSAMVDTLAATLGSEEEASRVIAAIEAAGYVCVPREPTEAMCIAGSNTGPVMDDTHIQWSTTRGGAAICYRLMIDAALTEGKHS